MFLDVVLVLVVVARDQQRTGLATAGADIAVGLFARTALPPAAEMLSITSG